jgi:hypothetical protein
MRATETSFGRAASRFAITVTAARATAMRAPATSEADATYAAEAAQVPLATGCDQLQFDGNGIFLKLCASAT